MKIKRNPNARVFAIKTFRDATDGLENHLKDTFYEVKDYGSGFGTTVRQNGDIVKGGVRDIVDTGELANSIKRTETVDKVTLTVTADHAAAVLHGHRTDKAFVPPRDYISPTIEEFRNRLK
jgi:hypothetical protein